MTASRYYDAHFLSYAASSSAYSAEIITSMVQKSLGPQSVLDVGCAMGTWLRKWKDVGVQDIQGVDGPYVNVEEIEIPRSSFAAFDLSRPFDVGRRFDLVQSLEVAEHISKEAAPIFIDSLERHADKFLLFSAAPPGQGGEWHVNEQPYEYWRKLIEPKGFYVLDCIRPAIASDSRISFWYRYNMFLYVRREVFPALPRELQEALVPAGRPLGDISPLPFRLRKTAVSMLPYPVQQMLARLKAKHIPSGSF